MRDGVDPLSGWAAGEIERGAMPGASWWVGDAAGAIAWGFTGSAAVEPRAVPLLPDTPFDLASLTKPLVTALLALLLERDGRLSLDTPLGSAFPELASGPFARSSLRDAAAHRAGFPPWVPLSMAGCTRDAYLRRIAACEPRTDRGETLYSDLGYVLLGFAIEDAAGQSLDELFAERVVSPLGLRRCGFPGTSPSFADAAATERGGYYERDLAGAEARPDGFRAVIKRGEVHDGNAWGLGGIAGHAGLFAVAEDVAAIALAICDPSRLGVPPSALEAMLLPAGERAGSRTIGFLLARDAESAGGLLPDEAAGHSGFTGTSLWIDRRRPRVYVLLTNRVHPSVPKEPFTATRRSFHAAAAAL